MNVEDKRKLVKSPLNYTGGKYKLLPQLLPLFPDKISKFIDVFAGGCNVGANVEAERVVFNDKDERVIHMIRDMCTYKGEMYSQEIESYIEIYGLDKEDKMAYLKLRQDYNQQKYKDPKLLFLLIAHSFSNQIRFNKSGEFNLPFGKRTYNDKMKSNLIKFIDKISWSSAFCSEDFRDIMSLRYDKNLFFYCDPPYLISTATYNERGGWTEKDEKDLLSKLDELNSQNIKFGLSNVFKHRGNKNDLLIEWAKKYSIHYIDSSYKNCNYQGKNNECETVEVYICNY